MSQASDYLEQQILNHIFRTGTFAKPASLYMALFNTNTDDTGDVTNEVSASGYARLSVLQSDNGWSNVTTGGTMSNLSVLSFLAPSGNWGSVVGFGMFTGSAKSDSGNLLIWGSLVNDKNINDGDGAPEWGIGDFAITLA